VRVNEPWCKRKRARFNTSTLSERLDAHLVKCVVSQVAPRADLDELISPHDDASLLNDLERVISQRASRG
jgi:hypothetical protein